MGAKLGKTPAVAATSLRSQQLHSQRLADPDATVSVLDIEPDSFGAWVRFDARYPLELLPFMAPEAFARDFVELNARLAAENTKEASFCAIARFVDDVLAVRYAAVGIDVRFIQQKASAGLCSRDVCFLQLLVPQAIHVKNPLPATKLVGLPFSPQRQLSAADHHVRRLRGDGAAVSPYFSSMGSRVSSSGSLAASDSSGGSVERRGSTERRDIYRAHAALHLQIPPAARTRSGSAGSPNHRGSFRFGANGEGVLLSRSASQSTRGIHTMLPVCRTHDYCCCLRIAHSTAFFHCDYSLCVAHTYVT